MHRIRYNGPGVQIQSITMPSHNNHEPNESHDVYEQDE
jgi:hypothetical protein